MDYKIQYDSQGLVPAVIQDYKTGELLMMAYMNEESFSKTIETGTTWFYSRERQKLWNKGETSGNCQIVKDISIDCDYDAVIVKVEQKGCACHTGHRSCFFNNVKCSGGSLNYEIMYEIENILEDRRKNPREGSYTNYLFDKGIDKILKKIGEESAEVIIAAKNPDAYETIYEMSDLFYHCLVLLNEKGIKLDDIYRELKGRYKK